MSFPGFISPLELRGLYDLALALVFPSRFEGWGLPVCEAFSAGLPVASSSATSLPDLVGDAGLLFDPDDTEQIADAVLGLWNDCGAAAALADRGRERGQLFNFDRAARLFRAHYRRVGGNPCRRKTVSFSRLRLWPDRRPESPPLMETNTPVRRVSLAVKRLLSILISRMRRAFGGLLQLTLHDQLGDLSRKTERLGSASVESVTYLGNELRAFDERLARIEAELAALRELLDRPESPERSDEVASGPRSG